jgi:hypothetical protein
VLAYVDQFVTAQGGDLTSAMFAGRCLKLQHLSSGTRRRRMQILRNFCHLRRREAGEFSPGRDHISSRTRKWFASWRSSARCPPHQRHRSVAKTCVWRSRSCTPPACGSASWSASLWETMTQVSTLYSFANRSFTSHASCHSRPTVPAKWISILPLAAPGRSPSRRRVHSFGTTLDAEPTTPAQDSLTRSGLS